MGHEEREIQRHTLLRGLNIGWLTRGPGGNYLSSIWPASCVYAPYFSYTRIHTPPTRRAHKSRSQAPGCRPPSAKVFPAPNLDDRSALNPFLVVHRRNLLVQTDAVECTRKLPRRTNWRPRVSISQSLLCRRATRLRAVRAKPIFQNAGNSHSCEHRSGDCAAGVYFRCRALFETSMRCECFICDCYTVIFVP